MGKKKYGIIAIGLVFALLVPISSAYATYDCKLSAVGILRVDQVHNMIKGFVFFGDNDGNDLRFEFVKIAFDSARMPRVVQTGMPFLVHHIDYNPAK
jgi:hypothetical protein